MNHVCTTDGGRKFLHDVIEFGIVFGTKTEFDLITVMMIALYRVLPDARGKMPIGCGFKINKNISSKMNF